MELITYVGQDILSESAVGENMQNQLFIIIAESTNTRSIPTTFLEVIPGKYFVPQDKPDKASNFLRHRARP